MQWDTKVGEQLTYDHNGLTIPYTVHDVSGSTPEGGNMSWDVEFQHGGHTYRLENLSGWGESTVYVDGEEQDGAGYDFHIKDGVTVGDLENWLLQDYLEKLGVPEELRDAYWAVEAGDARWTEDGGFTDAGEFDGEGEDGDE